MTPFPDRLAHPKTCLRLSSWERARAAIRQPQRIGLKPQRHNIKNHAGEEFAVFGWGDTGSPIMLHHATGFCAAVWSSIARSVAVGHRVFAFDARGHGDSTKSIGEISWQRYADDLADVSKSVLELCGVDAFAGAVGHSLGGTAALTAAVAEPDLFASLFLVEPVLIPATGPGARPAGRTVFSAATRMRTPRFASRAAAHEALAGTDPFRGFQDRVLADYIEYGLKDREEGDVELKCCPSTEASIYELGTTDVLESLASLTAKVKIISAAESRFAPAYDLLRERVPSFEFEQVEASHLAPMEIPDMLAPMIRKWVSC